MWIANDIGKVEAWKLRGNVFNTHRQKAAEYVARIEKMEFLCASSWRIASVNKE
jgi:hypothetical protein